MKICAVCGNRFQTLLAACPNCGIEGVVRTESAADAEELIDARWIQELSKRHVNLGAKLYERGKYNEAEVEYMKAIEINPMNVYAHGNMGLIFLRRDQPERAIEWFEKTLELNPHYEGGETILLKAKALANKKSSRK